MAAEHLTLGAVLRHWADQAPDERVIVQDDDAITFAALDERSRALAGRIVAAGVGKGARVGLLAPNGIEWVVLAAAVMRVGGVLVPLSTLLRPPELEAQLRGAAVSHLIAASEFRGRRYLDDLASLDPGLVELGRARRRQARLPALRHVWTLEELPTATVPAELVDALEWRVRPADDLVVLFTSGSRSAPKGVRHSHAGAIRATASQLDARRLGRGDRLYMPMPFFWMGGFGTALLSVLVAGATLLTEADPTPATTIALLERERATLFRGWPDQAVKIARDPAFASADLSSLRPGSLDAVLPPDLRGRPGARANIFGMTETFGPYCGDRLDHDLPPSAHGSCGRPFDGTEVRILDVDTAQPVGPGGQGEIAVRGPNVMLGIVGRLREATFTVDGFYRTGDLGHLDADGYLFYAGRVDDMFKVSGATVYPAEVEAALRASPLVQQAYVTNVVDDVTGADAVGAAVVLAPDATLDDVRDDVRTRLSAFKVPKRWVVLGSPAEVPTLASGKVDKPGLQALLSSVAPERTPIPSP
ncbi:MAG: acyl--CoA ligase [Actinomycetota bacterium]|nr:acyl--CoA ligase [Actinomycetota bacterium]